MEPRREGTSVAGADGGPFAGRSGGVHGGKAQVNGTSANMTATHDETTMSPASNIDRGGNTNTLRTEFTGALNGDVIVGTLILTQIIRPTNPSVVPSGAYVAGGSASYSITLR